MADAAKEAEEAAKRNKERELVADLPPNGGAGDLPPDEGVLPEDALPGDGPPPRGHDDYPPDDCPPPDGLPTMPESLCVPPNYE